jgi:hypothetical protein
MIAFIMIFKYKKVILNQSSVTHLKPFILTSDFFRGLLFGPNDLDSLLWNIKAAIFLSVALNCSPASPTDFL